MTKGLLLVNLGTPDAPKPKSIRRYLKAFLSDPYVIQLPRLLWLPILYGFILPFRPYRLAKLYKSIWTDKGSPLLVYSNDLTQKLQANLGDEYRVELGMRYGKPSIKKALEKLAECDMIKVIPLFPQYSITTTKTMNDYVARHIKKLGIHCRVDYQESYATHPLYIQALANAVQEHWHTHGRAEKLILSFHGIPQRYADKGDPYPLECLATAKALVNSLKLTSNQYRVAYQSRLGKMPWLSPYTDHVLAELAQEKVASVEILCPGFATDCLETLEEVNHLFRDLFLKTGGKQFHYIPALNDSDAQVNLLRALI